MMSCYKIIRNPYPVLNSHTLIDLSLDAERICSPDAVMAILDRL